MRFGAAALLVAAPLAYAELRPEWELGAGFGAVELPDYRGSDESRSYVLPVPYVIYRGDKLRVDRQGFRGVFYETERTSLDLSFGLGLPVDSDKNAARSGMPDLDPTFEAGPRLNVVLARDRARDWVLTLRLPVHAVIATDFSRAEDAGAVASPNVTYDTRPRLFEGRWRLGLQAGLLYAASRYHRYYYSVAPQFATAQRPAYEAHSGYSGAFARVNLTRRFRQTWFGAYARYDSVQGASFEASPLVRRDYAFTAGLAIAWVFAESERKVEVEVED